MEASWKHSALTQASVLLCSESAETWYEGKLARGEQGMLRILRGTEVVTDEPLRGVDESVFGVLALESEPVGPRL